MQIQSRTVYTKATVSNNDLYNVCQLSYRVSAIKCPIHPPLDPPTETEIDIGLRHGADSLGPLDVLVEARSSGVPAIVVAIVILEVASAVMLLIFVEYLVDCRKCATVLGTTNGILAL